MLDAIPWVAHTFAERRAVIEVQLGRLASLGSVPTSLSVWSRNSIRGRALSTHGFDVVNGKNPSRASGTPPNRIEIAALIGIPRGAPREHDASRWRLVDQDATLFTPQHDHGAAA